MTTGAAPADEGGEAPCFAHLLETPAGVADADLAGMVRALADAVVIADAEGTERWHERRRLHEELAAMRAEHARAE